MKKLFRKLILVLALVLFYMYDVAAQCAMCRATVESNVSAGDGGIGENLNTGILYLFFTPYLALAVIGYLWYKSSKANAAKNPNRRYYTN